MFLLGLVLLLLAPRAADAIARTAKAKPLVSAGVGLLAFFLIPIIAIAAFALGRRIIKGSRILAFLAGLVILGLLTLIPFAGSLIGFLAVIFGLGLLLVTLLRHRT